MRELLESYLESPTDNNCRWFHFRQWLVPKGTDILMKGSPKSCKNFSMSENPSKSNKLWFLIRPPYINDNCKKLTTCNKNSEFALLHSNHSNFHSQLWLTCLLPTKLTPLTVTETWYVLSLIYRVVLAGSAVEFMFNQTGHLTYYNHLWWHRE